MIRNPFQGANGAARYAAGRPYMHPLFMARLKPWLSGTDLGADVACGTGLGSVALAGLVARVLAFDVSAAMLAQATPQPRVTYARASAEALPVADASLDVLTVAQGLHWFDRPKFFAEARHTLKPGGVLAVRPGRVPGRLGGLQLPRGALRPPVPVRPRRTGRLPADPRQHPGRQR